MQQLDGFLHQHRVSVSAGSAAMCGVLLGYPWDSLKTRMQAFRFVSTLACVRELVQTEGFAGFYRGVLPVMATAAVFRAMSFSIYNSAKLDLHPHLEIHASFVAAGAFTGAVMAVVTAPMEFIKVSRQLQELNRKHHKSNHYKSTHETSNNHKSSHETNHYKSTHETSNNQPKLFNKETSNHQVKFNQEIINNQALQIQTKSTPNTTWQWAKHIVAAKGIAGLYSGFYPHILREVIGSAFYFGVYESIKLNFVTGSPNDWWVYFLGGGTAGTLVWIILFPIDLCKSVMQRDALLPVQKYTSASQFARMRYSKLGVRGFYIGLQPQLLRSFPVHATSFLVYEQIMKRL